MPDPGVCATCWAGLLPPDVLYRGRRDHPGFPSLVSQQHLSYILSPNINRYQSFLFLKYIIDEQDRTVGIAPQAVVVPLLVASGGLVIMV